MHFDWKTKKKWKIKSKANTNTIHGNQYYLSQRIITFTLNEIVLNALNEIFCIENVLLFSEFLLSTFSCHICKYQ